VGGADGEGVERRSGKSTKSIQRKFQHQHTINTRAKQFCPQNTLIDPFFIKRPSTSQHRTSVQSYFISDSQVGCSNPFDHCVSDSNSN